MATCCLRYCKSTIFQANHNAAQGDNVGCHVVCDTAKVRFFKQITTLRHKELLQTLLFAILQKYDFSSKSQLGTKYTEWLDSCLRYCKSTIFQANHNTPRRRILSRIVVCDTAKVRFFKQITTEGRDGEVVYSCLRYCKSTIFQANHNYNVTEPKVIGLFAILQKYDFSSKSQPAYVTAKSPLSCLRYCKSTIFQANHNKFLVFSYFLLLFAILQKYDFSSKSQLCKRNRSACTVVCDTAKVRFFKQITTITSVPNVKHSLFAILQKYDFSSKSQRLYFRNL